jgi:hypothetical protein
MANINLFKKDFLKQVVKTRLYYLRDHVNPAYYNGALNLDDGAQGFKLLRYLHTNNGSESMLTKK